MITTNALIESSPPNSWQQLQEVVARIYQEAGWSAEIERDVTTARGVVNIDVLARDPRPVPPITAFCECKHWRQAVPKTVVHSLRTVITDFGANWGIIISSAGFQKGAYEAAKYSTIRLLDWSAFQELMRDQWLRVFMVPQLFAMNDPLVEYTEPINSRIFRKADLLTELKQKAFRELRAKYLPLATLFLPLHPAYPRNSEVELQLPLETRLVGVKNPPEVAISPSVMKANSLRGVLEAYTEDVLRAIAEFDAIFGERA